MGLNVFQGLDVSQPGLPEALAAGGAAVFLVLLVPLLSACRRAACRWLWPEPSPELRAALALVARARLPESGPGLDVGGGLRLTNCGAVRSGPTWAEPLLSPRELRVYVAACQAKRAALEAEANLAAGREAAAILLRAARAADEPPAPPATPLFDHLMRVINDPGLRPHHPKNLERLYSPATRHLVFRESWVVMLMDGDRPDSALPVKNLLPPEEYLRWVEACEARYREVIVAHARLHAERKETV